MHPINLIRDAFRENLKNSKEKEEQSPTGPLDLSGVRDAVWTGRTQLDPQFFEYPEKKYRS